MPLNKQTPNRLSIETLKRHYFFTKKSFFCTRALLASGSHGSL